MAILVSAATGNLTAAATWKVVHAGTFQTLRATQETASQNIIVSVTGSTNFTVAANTTVDAVLLKHNNTISSPTGTFTVAIYNATTTTTVATMTINQTSLPIASATPNWFQFEFSSSVTLTTGNNYQIRLSASSSNQSAFFRRSATSGDWTFGLRTTTTQAPASGDILIIAGKYTASASSNYVVTNNNTSTALLLGNGVAGTCGIEVNYGSSLENQTTASTNYSLRVSGDFAFNGGSLFKCGTSANTFPQSSTATFEIDQPANQRFSLLIRSTVNAVTEFVAYEDQTGKRLQRSFLGAAISATNTSITVEDAGATNWKNGDEIVVGSTERNYQQVEYRTMSANESAGTVTVSSGFTNAHSRYHDSWNKLKVPVANLTKNIIFKGTSTTLRAANMTFGGFTNVTLSGVLFQNWGQLGFDQSQGTDNNGQLITPEAILVDIVIKDYTSGVRTVTRNPKDLSIEQLTAARALSISTFALEILNITENPTITNGFILNLGNIYSFGGTGTIDGRIRFTPITTNSSNFWNVTSSGSDFPGIDIYINGLNGNTTTNVYPFNIDGGTATRRDGIDWTVDFAVRVIACQGWVSGPACLIEGYQPPNWWWGISAVKNDGNGIFFSTVSDRGVVHNNGSETYYFCLSEQNSLAQIALSHTANVFPFTLKNVYVGATSTNPGTTFFIMRYALNSIISVIDVVGSTFPTSGIFSFTNTDSNALGAATKLYFDFSSVTSSTLTATKTFFVGSTGTQFTSESAFTYKDNSGNMYTYTRDAVMYPDSVNYYLNGPSTVFDTTGQTPRPSVARGEMQSYEVICVPMKKFVVPANKSAKVSVWIYVTGTPSMTAGLTAYNLSDMTTFAGGDSITTKNAWTKLTVSVPTSTSDRFIAARLSVSTPDIIVKISDWNVEFV